MPRSQHSESHFQYVLGQGFRQECNGPGNMKAKFTCRGMECRENAISPAGAVETRLL